MLAGPRRLQFTGHSPPLHQDLHLRKTSRTPPFGSNPAKVPSEALRALRGSEQVKSTGSSADGIQLEERVAIATGRRTTNVSQQKSEELAVERTRGARTGSCRERVQRRQRKHMPVDPLQPVLPASLERPLRTCSYVLTQSRLSLSRSVLCQSSVKTPSTRLQRWAISSVRAAACAVSRRR